MKTIPGDFVGCGGDFLKNEPWMDSRRACGTWPATRPCPYSTPTRALACADLREARDLRGEDMGAPRSGISVRHRAVGASGSVWTFFRVGVVGRGGGMCWSV